MGRYAGNLIRRRVEGFNPPPPFRYWDKGNLATVGRSFAVADLGQDLKFSGFFAWLLWLGIHIFYLIGFENRFIVLAQWAFTYITYGRSVRIFEPNEQASKSAKTVMHEMQPT
jgi:NADH dehydrogenase